VSWLGSRYIILGASHGVSMCHLREGLTAAGLSQDGGLEAALGAGTRG